MQGGHLHTHPTVLRGEDGGMGMAGGNCGRNAAAQRSTPTWWLYSIK
jgi:hypothetical protein